MSAKDRRNWIDSGVGAVLTRLLRTPVNPPELPVREGDSVLTTHPAPGFLSYSLLGLRIIAALLFLALIGASLAVAVEERALGLLLGAGLGVPLVILVFVLYLMTYVSYCTTWYVISDRSVRIRSGIITVLETTITFDNVQNVSVNQGPLQRIYGIADVRIDTAGGGGAGAGGQSHDNPFQNMHQGIIRGIDNAQEIREVIVGRMKKSGTSGINDDARRSVGGESKWSPHHIDTLRGIRNAIRQLSE